MWCTCASGRRVLDTAGRPLRAARVEAEADVALADDRGYFTITASMDSTMSSRAPGGELCLQRAVGSLADPASMVPHSGVTATGTETSSLIPQKRDIPVLLAMARADLDYLDMILGRPATRTFQGRTKLPSGDAVLPEERFLIA
jgi:hypothetical protein